MPPTRTRPVEPTEGLAITPAVAADRPAGPGSGGRPTLPLNYRAVASTGAAPIREVWVEMNGKQVANNHPSARGQSPIGQGQLTLPIGPERDIRASLVVVDTLGVQRVRVARHQQPGPASPPRKSKLEIVAIGADDFADKRFPRSNTARATPGTWRSSSASG